MNTVNISRAQLICISTMINKLNIGKEDKKVMVAGFSGGRTDSSSALAFEEAKAMIRHLKTLDPQEQKAERVRRKIISLAHEMGWKLPGGKADMKRIDDWCRKQFGKKGLNDYTLKDNELGRLAWVFENKVYKQFLEGI